MWTYKRSRDVWECNTTGGSRKARKQLPTESAAWLYCAERNGVEVPAKVDGEQGQDYRARIAAWVEQQIAEESAEPLEVPAEALEPVVDPALLYGPADAVIAAIADAALTPEEAGALLDMERSRVRTRKRVVAALEARAEEPEADPDE